MAKLHYLSGFFLFLLSLISCKTELVQNNNKGSIPIIFGLLDHTDSIHTIKITKAFLGEGDYLVYAQNPDSNYFKKVDAQIIEYNDYGNKTGRMWTLKDSVIHNKSTDGIFYAPEQRFFYFEEKNLDPAYYYELVGYTDEGKEQFTARTGLIDGFKVQASVLFPSFKIVFAENVIVPNDTDYPDWKFEIFEGLNAVNYEIGYRFNWTEYYLDESNASFSAEKIERIVKQDEPLNPKGFTAVISGLNFYEWVKEVVPDDPQIKYRTFDGIDLQISIAHKDLSLYMDVLNPVTEVTQEPADYTNVDGGYGLFSSRLLYTLKGIDLNSSSKKELAIGQYTATKLFCSNDPAHVGTPFYCP